MGVALEDDGLAIRVDVSRVVMVRRKYVHA